MKTNATVTSILGPIISKHQTMDCHGPFDIGPSLQQHLQHFDVYLLHDDMFD